MGHGKWKRGFQRTLKNSPRHPVAHGNFTLARVFGSFNWFIFLFREFTVLMINA
jgi:hypothetical protein